jgi:hypothetical protein
MTHWTATYREIAPQHQVPRNRRFEGSATGQVAPQAKAKLNLGSVILTPMRTSPLSPGPRIPRMARMECQILAMPIVLFYLLYQKRLREDKEFYPSNGTGG